MFYLTTHSTHFIYSYMASDIWLRTILIVRKETRCRHIGYSYRLTARIMHTTAFVTPVVEHWMEREIAQWVYMDYKLMQVVWSDIWNLCSKLHNGSTLKDRSDDPSHHERTLLPRSYISLPVRSKVEVNTNRQRPWLDDIAGMRTTTRNYFSEWVARKHLLTETHKYYIY